MAGPSTALHSMAALDSAYDRSKNKCGENSGKSTLSQMNVTAIQSSHAHMHSQGTLFHGGLTDRGLPCTDLPHIDKESNLAPLGSSALAMKFRKTSPESLRVKQMLAAVQKSPTQSSRLLLALNFRLVKGRPVFMSWEIWTEPQTESQYLPSASGNACSGRTKAWCFTYWRTTCGW